MSLPALLKSPRLLRTLTGLSVTIKSNRFAELTEAMKAGVDKAVRETALAIEGQAKGFAPVDTGALRASILAEPVKQFVWKVAPHVEYAIYQEFGTSRMPAHPFMIPAMMAEKDSFAARVRDAIGAVR